MIPKYSPVLLLLAVMGLAGCEQEGPLEEAGERADETVEEAGERVEDATDR